MAVVGVALVCASCGVEPIALSQLIKLIDEKVISYGIAEKKVFPALVKDPKLDMEAFIKQQDLATTSSSTELDNLVTAALTKHSQKIGEYKKG